MSADGEELLVRWETQAERVAMALEQLEAIAAVGIRMIQ